MACDAHRPSHSRPAVLVTVSGGNAYTFATRGVRVVLVDWDNLTSPSSLQDYTAEDVQALIDEVKALPTSLARRTQVLRDLREQLRRRRALAR